METDSENVWGAYCQSLGELSSSQRMNISKSAEKGVFCLLVLFFPHSSSCMNVDKNCSTELQLFHTINVTFDKYLPILPLFLHLSHSPIS